MNAKLALNDSARDEWEKLEKCLRDVRYDGQHSPHLIAVALANNSCEIANAMFKLWMVRADAGQLPLLRALFESSVRFAYLAKNPAENTLKLMLSDIEEGLKAVGREPTDDDSPKKMKRRTDLLLRKSELAAKSLKTAPKIYDMVREVGSPALYGVYRLLSSHVHAQWSALSQRTVQKNDLGSYVVSNSLLDDTTVTFLWKTVATLLEAIRYDFDKFQFESNV